MRQLNLPAKWLLPLACLLFTCLLPAGCVHSAGGDWMEYRIFCGAPESGTISEAEWRQFCDEHVTAEFPDGYTVLEATGYWKSGDASETLREDSHIIVILAPSDAGEKVRRIARQYRLLFQQESVLVTASPADAEFVESSF